MTYNLQAVLTGEMLKGKSKGKENKQTQEKMNTNQNKSCNE